MYYFYEWDMYMGGMSKKAYSKFPISPEVSFRLVWFYGISTFVGYLMPNPIYTYKQFYLKHFSFT